MLSERDKHPGSLACEQTASDGGDQRRRVLRLSQHWHCPLRTSPANARVSPARRTRLRLQISLRTTSSLAPGSVRIDRAVREFAGGAVRETSVRLAYGDRWLSSVVSDSPQLPRWFGQVGPLPAPAGEAALSLRLASVQPHHARASSVPTCPGASG